MYVILFKTKASAYDFLQTHIFSPPQGNRSALTINLETEVCMTCALRTFVEFIKVISCKNMVSLRSFFYHYFIISCEMTTAVL
jgi:hypothetical protein